MGDIHELDSYRPHEVRDAQCQRCGYKWIAVCLPETQHLDCPLCVDNIYEEPFFYWQKTPDRTAFFLGKRRIYERVSGFGCTAWYVFDRPVLHKTPEGFCLGSFNMDCKKARNNDNNQ